MVFHFSQKMQLNYKSLAYTFIMLNIVLLVRLNCRFFNEFLMNNERTIAREVRDEYVETMSKIYYSYFKSYTSRLMKLQVRTLFL